MANIQHAEVQQVASQGALKSARDAIFDMHRTEYPEDGEPSDWWCEQLAKAALESALPVLLGRIAKLEQALKPFAALKVTAADKRGGNCGIYGLEFKDIENAQRTIAEPRQ